MSSVLEIVKEIVRNVMPPDPVHGFPHVERVAKIALRLADECDNEVDVEALEIAAYLHDIARFSSEGGRNHAEASAKVAETLLKALGYPEERVRKVMDAVMSHSYSSGRKPITAEGKILSDADKLDALGAVGIVRVFMFSGEMGRSLDDSLKHFREKILKLPELMWTEAGRSEAAVRVAFVKEFLKRLEAELA